MFLYEECTHWRSVALCHKLVSKLRDKSFFQFLSLVLELPTEVSWVVHVIHIHFSSSSVDMQFKSFCNKYRQLCNLDAMTVNDYFSRFNSLLVRFYAKSLSNFAFPIPLGSW